MEASHQQIPEEVVNTAASLGISPEALQAALTGQMPVSVEAVPQEQGGGLPPVPGVETAEGVRTAPAETNEQRLERELAVSRQETKQVRDLAQRADEGRVVGSGGGGVNTQQDPPNLGSIEPGIRWAYFNGLISDEDLVDKVGPLLADLLKNHQGGVI